MKKRLLILLLLLASLVLVACSNSDKKEESKETETSTEATKETKSEVTKTTEENNDNDKPTDEEIRIAHYFEDKLHEESLKIADKYLELPVTDETMKKEAEEHDAMEKRLTLEVAEEFNITPEELNQIFLKVIAYDAANYNK